MKIWWQSSTQIHRLHDYRNALDAHLGSVKRADTEIHINGVDQASTGSIQFNAVVAMNSFGPGGILNKIIQAADQGYDAVAIGCFLDPALQEAREIVPIPVFGLGEISMLAACMYGHRFSGVAFHAKQAQYYDRKAFEYGLAARHIPFGNLGIDYAEVRKGLSEPKPIRDSFIRECHRLGALGAEVILVACATTNAIVQREKIKEVGGVLIMDCTAVLLKTVEAMADLSKSIGLRASRRLLYQGPERRALDDWMRTYNFRSGA